ncbi:MAG: hypothetical protein GIX02_11220, partial [Candidatus Eremiobacteraeota bacterium]|nr:hypothetical protein [Candidatus Eremiobacteraeota bacterium]
MQRPQMPTMILQPKRMPVTSPAVAPQPAQPREVDLPPVDVNDPRFPVIPPLAGGPATSTPRQAPQSTQQQAAGEDEASKIAVLQAAMSAQAVVGRGSEDQAESIVLPKTRAAEATVSAPGPGTVRTQSAANYRDVGAGDSESRFRAGGDVRSSPYRLKAGSVIPSALISAIDSDLPGLIVGQVRQNVYDSGTGRHLLIPQGAKVVGTYDARITYGQNRILVTWSRLIFPDGADVDLRAMTGADLAGHSGFDAQVNNHIRKLFQGALLLS